jgi:hypothetical protein
MEPTSETLENNTESVTKERKKPNLTSEDRAKRAERMRAMATSRNELLKKQKAERLNVPVEELDKPKEKKPRAKKAEGAKPPSDPPKQPILESQPQWGARGGEAPPISITAPEPAKEPSEPKKSKKSEKRVKARTLVIQSSSDSEDYGDSDTASESNNDEPVIYIAKKSKGKSKIVPKDKAITKAKPRAPEPVIVQPVVPVTRVKFF